MVHLLTECAGKTSMVFCRTINETQRLSILLRSLGLGAVPFHGDLSQSARLGALNKFKTRSRPILIGTDVASRGLDIPLVDIVINFDLPGESKTYIHRVGRTARAGRAGCCYNFVSQYDVELYQRIEAALGKKLAEHAVDREEVLAFGERVGEAQRIAVREMKRLHEARGTKGATLRGRRSGFNKAGKRERDGMDRDEG